MLHRLRTNKVPRAIALTGGAAALWLAASVPSGFGIVQIAMFAGPGMVLAVAMSWASNAGFPKRWTWQKGLAAAAVGAGVFPPFVALFFAWSGSFSPSVLVTLLVLSTWLALLSGLVGAFMRLTVPSRLARHRARREHNIAGGGHPRMVR